MRLVRLATAVALLAVAALTTACAGTPAATPTTAGTASSGVPSSPVATPEPTGSAAVEEPTCETILSETTVNDFAEAGWTVQQEPFVIGGTQLSDGLQCTWGDFSVASDHVQVFGWAPITDEEVDAVRTELLGNGWREVREDGSVFITENADTAAVTDDEGFGFTYQFGDGWVKLADTKQTLLLVEWPPA